MFRKNIVLVIPVRRSCAASCQFLAENLSQVGFFMGQVLEQAESKKKWTILLFFIVFFLLACLISLKISGNSLVYDSQNTLLPTVGVFLLSWWICRIHKKSGRALEVDPRNLIIANACDNRCAISSRGLAVF
jgi:hypothetical protein